MNLIRAVGNISDSALSSFQRAMENHQYASGESSTITTEQATAYITEALRLHVIKLRDESMEMSRKKAADTLRSSKAHVAVVKYRQTGKTEYMTSLHGAIDDTTPSETEPPN